MFIFNKHFLIMKNSLLCDRVSIVALSLSAFLGILAFVPGGVLSGSILKGYLLIAGVLVALVAWLLGRLIEGAFHIPWTPFFAGVGILIGALFLSALFSHTPYLSFFGEGFDQGTFAVFAALLLGLFLASMLFKTRGRIVTFLQGFFIVYVVIALYQLVHLIFPAVTSLNVFFNRADTPVGVWSDFAFLSGAVLIGGAVMLQFMKPPRKMRIIAMVSSLLALFFVILTNIFMVWVLVGSLAILILIYTLVINRFSEERNFPFMAFFLSLIALLFILANNLLGGVLANIFKASYVDVHPSLSATVHVAELSLRAHPIFGAGPNRFLNEWLTHRPSIVNSHTLWDVPFNAGASLLMTIAFLGGALGILAVLFFLMTFIRESIRKVFRNAVHPENGYLVFALFLIALYFLAAILFFAPGIAVTISAFAFLGLFFGAMIGEGRVHERTIYFLKDQRASFFSILSIVALILISAGTAYAATERFGSFIYFQKALTSMQSGDIDRANSRLTQAITLADLPLFERTRVLIASQSVQRTLALSSNSASSDSIKAVLQNAVSTGNTAARTAISIDPSDPANYIALGDFLRLIVPLKVDGVFPAAEDAYKRAIALAPDYPKTYLNLAELYFDSGDNKNARIYAQKAINEKPNYTEAFFLMSQIEVADGNSGAAMKRLEDATLIDPNNPDTYFELGLLRYHNGDYSGAAQSFTIAVRLNTQYLNAWYYLALADQKTGAYSDANAILIALHKRLPDNQDVTNALNGTSSVTPAPDTSTTKTKEKSKKLPVPTDTTQ